MRVVLWLLVYLVLMAAATQSLVGFWLWVAWGLIAFSASSPDPNPKKKKV